MINKFLGKITLLSVPLILIFVGLEIGIRLLPNSYKIKAQQINRRKSEIELLILGSSHTFFGINPELLSFPAQNMAHVSQQIKHDSQIFNIYQPQMENLRFLILSYSLQTLYDRGEDLPFINKNYVIYYGLTSDLGFVHNFEIFAFPLFSRVVKTIIELPDFNFEYPINDYGFGVGYEKKAYSIAD